MKFNITFEQQRKYIRRFYLIGLAIFTVLLLCIVLFKDVNVNADDSDNYYSTDDSWSLDKRFATYVDLKKLGSYYNEGSNTLSLYFRLPNMKQDASLVYRSKDVYTRLLIEDEVIYETSYHDHPMYNKSPGNIWNVALITSSHSNQIVELQIKYAYDTNAVTVDHIYFGHKSDIVNSLVTKKIGALIISILIQIIGLALIVFEFIPRPATRKTYNLLYLGIYAFIIGVWSLLETNVVQFFFHDARLLQLIDNIVMIADSLPLMLYLDSEFNIFKNRFYRIISIIDIIYMWSAGIGQILCITDMHYMLMGSWVATAVFALIPIYITLKNFIVSIKNKKFSLIATLQMIGVVSLVFLAFVELIRYIDTDTMDRAVSVRLGMLCFIFFFGIAAEVQTFSIMRDGMRYAMVRELAYRDGLTKLRNRTSYLETLERYANNQENKVGIVYLDVNNLKTVNDGLGHEWGDKLITLASQVIDSSFGIHGKSYRIGGDEFCVLICDENAESIYQNAKKDFIIAINQVNEANYYPFTLQIAHGFAVCEQADKDKLKTMVDTADELMYANKKALKEKIISQTIN